MKNRLETNRKLLQILSQIIEDHPDARFSQILYNFNFVRPTLSSDQMEMVWLDEYDFESDDLLKRITILTDYPRK